MDAVRLHIVYDKCAGYPQLMGKPHICDTMVDEHNEFAS